MSSRSEALDLSQTFEKMKNPDPDLRYMATSDLNVSLGKMKGKKFIDNEQREIMSGLLTLLTDEANDVKDITIKFKDDAVRCEEGVGCEQRCCFR
ncbi:transcription enhancer protein, putative, partial [Entamoeba invadens IP1]